MRRLCKTFVPQGNALIQIFHIVVCCFVFLGIAVPDALAHKLRVGLALPSSRESRWEYDLQAFQEIAREYNFDLLVRFAGNNQNQQNLQVRELVTLGIDVIVIAPDVPAQADAALARARAEGVLVICYERIAKNVALDAFITTSARRVGAMTGEYLREHAPEGNYIIIEPPATDSSSKEYMQGVNEYLAPSIKNGAIKVVSRGEATAWKASAAEKIVASALNKTTAIKGILAPNDDTARGAVNALTKRHLPSPVITGQDATADALERIMLGSQSMTIFTDYHRLARKTGETILLLIQNKPVNATTTTFNGKAHIPTIIVPAFSIDRRNLLWLLRQPEFRNTRSD